MFLQILYIPDLTWKFWAKRCGLYARFYGKNNMLSMDSQNIKMSEHYKQT